MSIVQRSLVKGYRSGLFVRSCRSSSNESKKTEVVPKQAVPEAKENSVPGLSSKVLSVPNGEVGSGASKTGNYKNPEYFCYHQSSYFDAELEMLKYRLPQPSAVAK